MKRSPLNYTVSMKGRTVILNNLSWLGAYKRGSRGVFRSNSSIYDGVFSCQKNVAHLITIRFLVSFKVLDLVLEDLIT